MNQTETELKPDRIQDVPVGDHKLVPTQRAATDRRQAAPPWPPEEDAVQRVDRKLDQLERLSELLATDDTYVVEPFDGQLPDTFKLSVVIPVYNEAKTVRELIARVLALSVPVEVVIVDDGSSDGTREMLEQFRRVENVKIVYHGRNRGKGAALQTGFQYVTGDIVVVQDADLEYDPRDIIPVMKPILEGDADVVYGSRFLSNGCRGSSGLHRFGNRMLTVASNMFTGLRLTDMETCYKAFRADVLKDIRIRQNRFGFEPEITAKLARRGHRIAEVPISYDARGWEEGKKIGVKDGINAFYCILRYWLVD
jgi:glycosyltransferase involved in cell wall biosynthesis